MIFCHELMKFWHLNIEPHLSCNIIAIDNYDLLILALAL